MKHSQLFFFKDSFKYKFSTINSEFTYCSGLTLKETSLLYVCGLELYVVASFKPEQLKRKKIFNIHTYSKFLDNLIFQNG